MNVSCIDTQSAGFWISNPLTALAELISTAVRESKETSLKRDWSLFCNVDVQKLLNSLGAEAEESPVFPESPWAGHSFSSA
jgi:hypothetical protein